MVRGSGGARRGYATEIVLDFAVQIGAVRFTIEG